MRVELRLHHRKLRLVQLALALDGTLKILPVFARHAVEACGQAAHLVLAAAAQLRGVVALFHALHRLVKLIDGLREIAAEEPRAEKAEQQAEYAHGGAGGVHRCHDLAGVYLRLAQSQSEARVRALAEIDVVVTAAERRAGQQLRAERRDRLIGAYAVGAVYLPPCAV